MSEYWVSKKRYFCKYCDVYIADDVPSRQHHENGLRHKGNVERFVRGLYKAGEKRKKDADEEKREMRRIEQAASAAFAEDVGAGRAQYSATPNSSSSAAASSSQKPRKSGGISDYSTPESLGYTDPDIERARAEAERRRMEGVAGDWQVVDPTPTEPPSDTGEELKQHGEDAQNPEASEDTSKKRPVPDPADEDEGRWKLRKKSTAIGLGEIYDPGVIAIKPKVKAEVKAEETTRITTQSSAGTSVVGDANATALPRWAPVKWKKAGEPADDTNGESSSGPADGDTSPTEQPPQQTLPDSSDADVKPEPDPVVGAPLTLSEEVTGTSSGGSLFRKRRAPVGGGVSNRGRRF